MSPAMCFSLRSDALAVASQLYPTPTRMAGRREERSEAQHQRGVDLDALHTLISAHVAQDGGKLVTLCVRRRVGREPCRREGTR